MLNDVRGATSFAPLNEVIVGFANKDGGIIAKQNPVSLNITNQVNAEIGFADVVYPQDYTNTVQSVELIIKPPFEIAKDIQFRIKFNDTFILKLSTFKVRLQYG